MSLSLARALHVLAVVVWIGGVAFVTTVVLPGVAQWRSPGERVAFFEQLERGFAVQSRWTTMIVGASGFYLVHAFDLWDRFLVPGYWWMHAMVGVWALFTLMLFVLEPRVLHRAFRDHAVRDPEGTFRRLLILHRVLLALALLTVAGAVAGVHGGY